MSSPTVVIVVDPFYTPRTEAFKSLGFDVHGVTGFTYPQPLKAELPRQYGVRVANQQIDYIIGQPSTVTVTQVDDALIMGIVTIVCCGRSIISINSADNDQVQSIIKKLSGRRHRVLTTIAYKRQGKICHKQVETAVQWKRLSMLEIKTFLNTEHPQKVGGYLPVTLAAQKFIKSINGMPSNLSGAPVLTLGNILDGIKHNNEPSLPTKNSQ